MATRRNPTDLTLRNLRAMKKRTDALEMSYVLLQHRVSKLEKAAAARKKTP